MTADEHADRWRSAHHTGWNAYRKWQREGWPERECVAAAIGAALIDAGVAEAADRESEKRLESPVMRAETRRDWSLRCCGSTAYLTIRPPVDRRSGWPVFAVLARFR